MNTFRYTLADLVVNDGEIQQQNGDPFDQVAYSRFKYGWVPPALAYGAGLAELIADQLFEVVGGEPITIISAPYKYLPTASESIAQALLQDLSRRAAQIGREFPSLIPFWKSQVGDSSYARSSEAERLKTLTSLGLHIDESRITNCHVLAVDDIRITGAAEKVTAHYLEALQPSSIWYLHAAGLPEDIGKAHPGLEDELNQAAIHHLDYILKEVRFGQFRLNTRVLRFILETRDHDDFCDFLAKAPLTLVLEIYQASVGNGFEYYQRYYDKLEVVEQLLDKTCLNYAVSADRMWLVQEREMRG